VQFLECIHNYSIDTEASHQRTSNLTTEGIKL
jgi:hypothetical protein